MFRPINCSMKDFLRKSIPLLVLMSSILFSQDGKKPLNTYGETFAVNAYISEDFAKETNLTEQAALSTTKLRLRTNGVPYGSLESSIATLDIYVSAIEIESASGESMDSYAFSLTLVFNRWLLDEGGEDLYAATYMNDYIGYADTGTAKKFLVDGIKDLIDEFSIDFIEQNNL